MDIIQQHRVLTEFAKSLEKKFPPLNPRLKFDIGGVSVQPKVAIQGSGDVSDIPANFPGGSGDIRRSNLAASGKLGFDARTEGGYNFGAGVSGNYARGRLEFPEEFGALPAVKYGTSGVDINEMDAYLNTPSGINLRGSYNPQTDDYYVRAGLKVPF